MIYLLLTLSIMAPSTLLADVVVPTRTIRANTIVSASDVAIKQIENSNGYLHTRDVIGQEARTTLYAGRPIRVDDIGPPAIIARNEIIPIKFISKGLVITTEGRSLQRGGIGDRIRIMNIDSRATLFGLVQADGSATVRR